MSCLSLTSSNSSCLRTSCKYEALSYLANFGWEEGGEKRRNPSLVCTNSLFGDSTITRASGSRCEAAYTVALGLIKSQALWSSTTPPAETDVRLSKSLSQAASPVSGSDISLNRLKVNPTRSCSPPSTVHCAAVGPEKPSFSRPQRAFRPSAPKKKHPKEYSHKPLFTSKGNKVSLRAHVCCCSL